MRNLIAICLVAGSLVPFAATAADPRFCHDYAESAVDQTRRAFDNRRCEREAHGPRWSTHYRGHFDWCLGARYEDARREREIRHEILERCWDRR